MGDIWSPNPIKSEIWWLDTSSSPSLCFGNHDWCCAFNHNHNENVQLTENCNPGPASAGGWWCWAQRAGGNYRDINIQGESGDWGWLGRGCIAADAIYPSHRLKPVNFDAGYLHELRLPVHEGVVRACKHDADGRHVGYVWRLTWHDAALGHVEQQGEALAREGVVEVVVVVVAVLVQDLGGVLRHPALNSTLVWQSS